MLTDSGTATRRPTDVAIWWRWWAMASYAHVVGTPGIDGAWGRALANVAVGWLAIAVIARPDRRPWRTALAAGVVIAAVAEAPFVGNHWWLAAAVSGAALLARPWAEGDDGFAHRFFPTARLILLTFYSFAAFAKLNTGFLDPIESCARFFANQTLSFFQLPEIPGGSPVATVLAFVTLAIELSVPVLLIIGRTRRAGVWLAVLFHLVLTLDLRQHFYDFTMVLIPLFVLFAPPAFLRTIDRVLPRSGIGGGAPWMALAAAQVAAFHLPVGTVPKVLAIVFAWSFWVVLALAILWGLRLAWRTGADRWPSDGEAGWTVSFRPSGLAGAALVALVVLNGLSPYLEIKTATGFNMYANLVTADGETNHLLVRRTAGLRAGQGETVEVLDADDEDLASYVDSGFTLPVANLADYLAEHPSVSVTYRLADGTIETYPAADGVTPSVEPRPMAWWADRFLLFRAVPTAEPPACQNAWLPAR